MVLAGIKFSCKSKAQILYVYKHDKHDMNSVIASLGKNLILIGILTLSAYNFFYQGIDWKDVLAIQSLAGVAYVFLSCYEFLNASFKASLPVQRFPYFTNSYIMFRVLKITFFLALSILLFTSGNRVKYIYPICLIIAATEGVITWLKYSKSLCFVNIYANYLLIVQSKFTRIFASEISLVEYRHDIFFFVKKNNKTVEIRLVHIRNRERFIYAINEWINRNQVFVSTESRMKIEEQISL